MVDRFHPEIEELIKDRMASGTYASEDELIRDAMEALEQREQARVVRWNERNRLAVEQSRNGLSRSLRDEEVLHRLRERLAHEGILT